MWVAKTLLIALVINHHNFTQRGIIQSLFFQMLLDLHYECRFFVQILFPYVVYIKIPYFIFFLSNQVFQVIGTSCQPFLLFFFASSISCQCLHGKIVNVATEISFFLFLFLPIFIFF